MRRLHSFSLIACAIFVLVVCDLEIGRAQSYEYDVDGRLVKVTYDDGATIQYRYDPSGNMLSRTVSSRVSFHRGDPNRDGRVDVSDGVFVFLFLFDDEVSLGCRESADANNDGKIDLTDGIHLLDYIFDGEAPPAAPGPPGSPCGPDPDPPGGEGDLGCDLYDQC